MKVLSVLLFAPAIVWAQSEDELSTARAHIFAQLTIVHPVASRMRLGTSLRVCQHKEMAEAVEPTQDEMNTAAGESVANLVSGSGPAARILKQMPLNKKAEMAVTVVAEVNVYRIGYTNAMEMWVRSDPSICKSFLDSGTKFVARQFLNDRSQRRVSPPITVR